MLATSTRIPVKFSLSYPRNQLLTKYKLFVPMIEELNKFYGILISESAKNRKYTLRFVRNIFLWKKKNVKRNLHDFIISMHFRFDFVRENQTRAIKNIFRFSESQLPWKHIKVLGNIICTEREMRNERNDNNKIKKYKLLLLFGNLYGYGSIRFPRPEYVETIVHSTSQDPNDHGRM